MAPNARSRAFNLKGALIIILIVLLNDEHIVGWLSQSGELFGVKAMQKFSSAAARLAAGSVIAAAALVGWSTAGAETSQPTSYYQTAQQCIRDGIAYCTATYPSGADRQQCIADIRAACNGS
ncbi:hypothetical protein [Brevundimonas sp. 374]|uniref:hypothetical protein n=1 Tax=Brevundimonas sp. 374 TaxID=1150400 RepID=UPI00088E0C9A|nr:hypothetical protein [Brevundimonas sp. 374]SDQ12025.1 hypothetical protein SAMN02787020_0187 [Brevundimonas sp. 374]